jgi:hypothetical protein
MDAKVVVAAVIAAIPVVVYVYAMKRIVRATWREVFVPFGQERKEAELHAAE